MPIAYIYLIVQKRVNLINNFCGTTIMAGIKIRSLNLTRIFVARLRTEPWDVNAIWPQTRPQHVRSWNNLKKVIVTFSNVTFDPVSVSLRNFTQTFVVRITFMFCFYSSNYFHFILIGVTAEFKRFSKKTNAKYISEKKNRQIRLCKTILASYTCNKCNKYASQCTNMGDHKQTWRTDQVSIGKHM